MAYGMIWSHLSPQFPKEKKKKQKQRETKENMLSALKWLELRIRRPVCTERRTPHTYIRTLAHTHINCSTKEKPKLNTASISSTKIMNNIYYYVL